MGAQTGGSIGAQAGSRAAAASVKTSLQRSACGAPTRWTPAQGKAVAVFMRAHKDDEGMQILAPEWERLDNQVRTCRGEAARP